MATKDLVPAGQRDVVVRNTRMRVAALLAQTFDELDRGKAARDPVKALCDEYWKDPLRFLERVEKLSTDAAGPGQPGATNIGALFLQAVMQNNNPQPANEPVTIDGVQAGCEDW